MIQYPNRITDQLTVDKFREIIDTVNGHTQQIAANAAAIAPPLTIAQIKAALTLGGSSPINVTGLLGTLQQLQPSAKSGTHAQRLTTPAQAGAFFIETDRTVLYEGQSFGGGSAVWVYVAGRYVSTLSNEPGDLGLTDAGFLFLATDTALHVRWSGAAWIEEYQASDAGTVNALAILSLIHRTSGTPAAGFGASLAYLLDSSTRVERMAAFLEVIWNVATNGSEGADFIVSLMNAGAAAAEKFRVTKDGDSLVARDAAIGRNLTITGGINGYEGLPPTDGQLLIGDTAANRFDIATLTGTPHEVIVTNGAGAVTLSTPQAIDTSSNVGFNSVGTPLVTTPQIDSAADLFLNAAGNVKFGALTAIGAETLTDYIEIKDAGGTVRKLAVVS